MTEKGEHTGQTGSLRVAAYIALALLLHGVALPIAVLWWEATTPKAPKAVDMLALADYSQAVNEARKQRQEAQSQHPLPQRPELAKKKDEQAKGQIVELPPSADSRAPDRADYLSEHNTRTERETRSRHASSDYDNVMNELSVAKKQALATPQAPQASSALEVGPDKPNKAKPKAKPDNLKGALEIPNQSARDRLALQIDPKLGSFRNQGEAAKVEGNSDRLKLAPGESPEKTDESGTALKQGLTMADLVPPVGVLARLSGGPSNDSLEGVEEGEGTFLNSKEFKYASFFNRLKRSVSQQWKPLVEYQRRDPTGNIYGYRARITVLTITLSAEGALTEIKVKQSSGVDFLDKEALAAFQRAEPFPNPPKGLIDTSGHVTFPFGFHIDFNGRGGFGAP